MNKHETREVNKLTHWHSLNVDAGLIARSLSALIRAARTNKSAAALRALADQWGLTNHPKFIA